MIENTESRKEKSNTKADLERKKLLLEIEDLKRSWWKKPTYIAALFPTVLALLTLTYGFINGYFQAEFSRMENQKRDLEAQNEKLIQKRSELLGNIREVEDLLKEPISELNNNSEKLAKLRLRISRMEYLNRLLNEKEIQEVEEYLKQMKAFREREAQD